MRVKMFQAFTSREALGTTAATRLEELINEFIDEENERKGRNGTLEILDIKFQRYTREDNGDISYSALMIYE